jgi:hypothetical protein
MVLTFDVADGNALTMMDSVAAGHVRFRWQS